MRHNLLLIRLALVLALPFVGLAFVALMVARLMHPPIDWHRVSQIPAAPPGCGRWQIMTGENASGLLSDYDVRLLKVSALADNDVWVRGTKAETIHVPDDGGDHHIYYEVAPRLRQTTSPSNCLASMPVRVQ